MKILLVSGPGISLKQPYQSGIEAFIVTFANHLCRKGHVVDVVAEEADSNSSFNLVDPFKKYDTYKPLTSKHLEEAYQFKGLPVGCYDVIHYNMFYPHLIAAGMLFKKKSFLSLHSPADDNRISFYQKLSNEKDLTLVAISKRIKSQYDNVLNEDLPLINNGINLDDWPMSTVRKPKYLLWSARITEEKNVSAAIELSKKIKIPLKIAGRIVDQKYYEKAVKPHLSDQIHYIGHVKQADLNNLAQDAIAYIATATWQEPFGLAALEMLASGVPVVGFKTAVPQDWEHKSVLTTYSTRWQDLVELVQKSKAISPDTCRDFASSMSIERMSMEYLKLYAKKSHCNEVAA